MTITKAVIPAAGLGTRFIPATKAIPKEMLPVVDKPAIQYIVEEAAAAGLSDVLMITGRSKRALEDHFDSVPELEANLEAKGDAERLAAIKAPSTVADMHFIRQGEPLGLGHAVWRAKQHVGQETFAVLLGDDMIDERDPILPVMAEIAERTGGSVVLLLEVEPDKVSMYGCAAVSPVDTKISGDLDVPAGDVYKLSELVEKPSIEEAPSNLAVIGRYVLNPAVFDVLERTAPGRGGEIQLTDALGELADMPASEGGGVYGVVFRGRRYDTGDKLDYLKAIVQLASERDDLGPDFNEWLMSFVGSELS